MPLYSFQALDGSGKKRSGTIEAHDEKEAKDKLREQGLMISSLTPKTSLSSKQNLKGDELVAFTVQLSQLVSAGVPLYESLVAIEENCRAEKYHATILSLCDQIKAGTSLSEAMKGYPGSFDRLYSSMITAGESSGALDIVLERLALLMSKQNKLRKQLVTAMIYPGILASFSLVVIALLIGFVVPSMEGMFAERQVNSFTQAVISASHFIKDYWWLYIPILGLSIAAIVRFLRTPKGRAWKERTLLKIPVIRTLIIQTAVARFSRTMGTLQQGGVTMISSLRIAREVMKNAVLEHEMKEAEDRVIEGSSLSNELSKSKYIPHIVARMLAVGEDAGSSGIMFTKIADMYEEDIEKSLDQLMALAQPLILIVMGTIIGTVLLAILIPLTDVSSFSA